MCYSLEDAATGMLKLNIGDHVYIIQSPDSGQHAEEKITLDEQPLYEILNISLPESVDDSELVYHVRRLQDAKAEKTVEEETKKCHASQLLRKLYNCKYCSQSYAKVHPHDEHAKNCIKKQVVENKKTTKKGTSIKEKLPAPNEFVIEQQIRASYYCLVTSSLPDFSLKQTPAFQFPMKQTYCGIDAGEKFLDFICQTADKIYQKYIKTPK